MTTFSWNEIDLVVFDADGTLRQRKDGSDKAPLADRDWETLQRLGVA